VRNKLTYTSSLAIQRLLNPTLSWRILHLLLCRLTSPIVRISSYLSSPASIGAATYVRPQVFWNFRRCWRQYLLVVSDWEQDIQAATSAGDLAILAASGVRLGVLVVPILVPQCNRGNKRTYILTRSALGCNMISSSVLLCMHRPSSPLPVRRDDYVASYYGFTSIGSRLNP